jgi:hypothetical protein
MQTRKQEKGKHKIDSNLIILLPGEWGSENPSEVVNKFRNYEI